MIIAARYLVWMRASCILITIGVILYVYSFFLNDLETLHAKLRKRANTDELTEVGNRRVLFETGSKIFSHGDKHQFALLIFDIDYFKKVNDTYGHPAGDEILKSLTRLVLDNISKGDTLTRFGGEEFAVILQEIDAFQANQVAERLRACVENAVFILQDGKQVKITISIGLTYFSRELESFDEMIRRSDIALYRAKEGGRNQVVVYNKA
jgi:diguanylate cyclase (GGDEF)-like protein